ncbi:hypothetical protein WR25_04672 [Diploscapter pachys]|uniref:Uncharacterized protein n=1 Tax=Diploscapter pachys TaxID=2018661 RepID=A0A2A2K5I3_9BILA|nr:hypothetical protein WR25_04672 [Diploscapter pachys]
MRQMPWPGGGRKAPSSPPPPGGGGPFGASRMVEGEVGDAVYNGVRRFPPPPSALSRCHLPLAGEDFRQATLSVPAIGSTRVRRPLAVSTRYSPPAIIGTHSHWPMWMPVASMKVPWNCGSGSRKNSTMNRAMP